MYTTKSLTLCKNSRHALYQPPDLEDGPNSGYLVMQDDETIPSHFFGLLKDRSIKDLPFPQNKLLTIDNTYGVGDNSSHSYDNVYLIPVVNQPVASNLYYVIKADGEHKGKAYASSKEEDRKFFGLLVNDVNPRPFNHEDRYQQFEFSKTYLKNTLKAKSIAPNAHPPWCLRNKWWEIKISKTPGNFTLGEATGVNSSLRARLPDFNFPISEQCSTPIEVGKWYCPFMFIHEGAEKERIEHSVYYEMTLVQRWDRVFKTENNGNSSREKVVRVDVVVPKKMVRMDGHRAVETYQNNGNPIMWFTTRYQDVGLSKLIVDRMIWEEEKVGWVKNDGVKEVRVNKEEMYGGVNGWRSFGCYVLVESFVLKRNNGRIVMIYDFMHTHNLRTKWE